MTSRSIRSLFLAGIFSLPLTVLAQASGLVPCGNNTSSDYISSAAGNTNYMLATACSFCNLAQLIQNVVNFLIMISIPISVAMFAWAGIIFFTNAGNPKRIAHAKQIFSSVFIGFIIAVSGWLVVQIVLQSITNSNFYLANNWTALQCGARPRDLQLQNVLTGVTVTAVTPTPGGGGPGSNQPAPWGGDISQYCGTSATCTNEQGSAAVQAYNQANQQNQISASSNVSYGGVNPALLQAIFNDTANAGPAGGITITSANDSTHAASSEHTTGNAVDIVTSDAFRSYMTTSFTSVPNAIAPGQPAYRDSNGYIWSQEIAGSTANSTGTHWHVSKDGH